MGKLYAILTGGEYDPKFLTTESSFLYTASDDGPWVQLVPKNMVARLTKLSDREIVAVAGEWSKIEEFDPKYCDWPAGAVERFVREIAALSRKAESEGKSVLTWTCL